MTPKKKNVEVESLETVVEETTQTPVEEVVEEKPVEEVKKEKHVVIKEQEYKQFSTISAPAEIKKIIDFYWITSNDLFLWTYVDMGLSKDEVETIKKWYATLI